MAVTITCPSSSSTSAKENTHSDPASKHFSLGAALLLISNGGCGLIGNFAGFALNCHNPSLLLRWIEPGTHYLHSQFKTLFFVLCRQLSLFPLLAWCLLITRHFPAALADQCWFLKAGTEISCSSVSSNLIFKMIMTMKDILTELRSGRLGSIIKHCCF